MLIGDFARLGQVSVRMLRHYDQIGLLEPDSVDRCSGYRLYSPEQLSVLNRIVALKDLGLSLDQINRILTEPIEVDELHGMLRLRRTELEGEMRVTGIRLAAVESRLRMIEKETQMSADYVVKPVPAVRLAALTDTLDPAEMGQRIGPMFDHAAALLESTHSSLATPIAAYSETEAGMDVSVGFAYDGTPPPDLQVIELPAATAVCGVHLGHVSTIRESWQALHRWLVENDYKHAGPCREFYVRSQSEDQEDWVTELQQPVHQN